MLVCPHPRVRQASTDCIVQLHGCSCGSKLRKERRPSARVGEPRRAWRIAFAPVKVRDCSCWRSPSAAAKELNISVNTVGTHIRSAYSKLGVQSRVQLADALRGLDRSQPGR